MYLKNMFLKVFRTVVIPITILFCEPSTVKALFRSQNVI